MLVAEALGISVGNAAILRDVEARLMPGRVTAIVGPNGAGKSTLLSCLAGLRAPDQGRVLLDGASLQDIAVRLRAKRIGYLPQDAPLHWNIAVRALVALGRFPYDDATSPDGRAAIDRAMADLALTDLADRLAGTLSGGERARAMLARVLAGAPDWILADEPLAALDIAHRHALMIELRAIAARGVGVAIVAHDLALAARFADDAILFDRGALVAAGPVGDVLTPAMLEPVFDVAFAYAQMGDARVLISDLR
ncbi:iron complex transport system ATP-binding protein [Sphingobium xanthum]|jgi:iron complex transport system ATP-binding protein|uniref:ABC transporter ATP-binding protein n=1 Tax=Sphingobium xanthum TaxID=1387165 RepID=UPI001C8CCF9A|nr:ABC transporter ATP-binding protein [Sphingobium xanthum]